MQLETEHWQADELSADEQHQIERFQRATGRGFHDPAFHQDAVEHWRAVAVGQKMRMSMVYDRQAVDPSLHAREPVHTYGAFPGVLNAGADEAVPIHKVTAVTVSPSYRRRGILGRQITEDLHHAKSQGFPLAALTASDARIYGRWGFGVSSYQNSFVLDCAQGVPLRQPMPGTVQEASPESLEPVFDDLARRCLAANYGSVDASPYDRGYLLGRFEGWETMQVPKDARVAVHRDAGGLIDGLLSYKFNGWDSKVRGMRVRGLIAQNPAARVALLEFLGNHDLIGEVHAVGPVRDPLRLALADERLYRQERTSDVLWLRVLDPVAALQAKSWGGDGKFTLVLSDPLGLAAGEFTIEISARRARVERRRGPAGLPELHLDVATLSRLYLGAVNLTDLHDLGQVQCSSPARLEELSMLFAQPHTAFTPYEF